MILRYHQLLAKQHLFAEDLIARQREMNRVLEENMKAVITHALAAGQPVPGKPEDSNDE